MLINTEFDSQISRMGLDEVFIDALKDSYEEFSKQIMIELTLFKYEPKSFGFSDLELVSREYAIQKYFEPRLETYVRQHLVTSFFERVLEERGYSVYTPTYHVPEDQYVDGEIFCSNKEFEDNAGFEFVIHSDDQLIGCRMTDIHSWQADRFFQRGLVTKIIIIDWLNVNGISEQEKNNRTYGIAGDVDILGIRQFLAAWLGTKESQAYELFMKHVLQKYKETIGISSLPKLTAPILFEHRLEEEANVLKVKIREIKSAAAIKQSGTVSPPGQSSNLQYGYRIIDPASFVSKKDIQHSSNLEERSKRLLTDAGTLDTYEKRKLYKVLIGKGDFAKSFLTSEYLYYQYNESDLFDYTAIVSGYLKSIEQLLATIVFCYANGGKRIKSNGKKKADGTFPTSSKKEGNVFKIDLTTTEAAFVDTTIGSLIHFVDEYKDDIMIVDSQYRSVIIDCLECYRIECRNDSFHSHNNYDWDRVEKIRHNTLFLYIILLGGFRLGSDQEIQSKFEVLIDDRLERIYYWLRKTQMYTFRMRFKDETEYYLATRRAESSFPQYDNNGMLQDGFSIELRCRKEKDNSKNDRYFLMTRENVPDEIWYTTYANSYPIDIGF